VLTEAIDQCAEDLEEILPPSTAAASRVAARPELELVPPLESEPRLGRDFTKLWTATAASNLSDGIRQAALPLLVASLTRDPTQVAGVAFAGQAPWLLFGLASGAIVDRFERRRIIGAAHLFRMAVVVLLAVAVAGGFATIPLLYVAAFLLGIAETLFDNATQVIVPELVDESLLEVANGRQTMALVTGQQLAGPVIGAALFAVAVSAPLMVDALALCVATLAVFSIRRGTPPPARAKTSIRHDIGEGLRWLWGHRAVRTISLAAAVVNIALVAHMAVFVLFTLDVLGLSGVGYALILACYAVGGVAGGWIAPRVAAALRPRGAIMLALAGAAAAVLVTGLTSSPWVTAAMQVVLAVAGSIWHVVTCTLRQRLTPPALLGRVTGTHQLLSWGGASLGALAGGIIAAHLGLRAPFLLGAVALAVVAVVFAVVKFEPRRLPRHAAPRHRYFARSTPRHAA